MATKALAWLLLPALGLAELGGQLYFSSRPPRVEEWRAVREPVAALRKAGDLIVVAPSWAEPNARHAFGDALMPLEQVARADESTQARAIEVSILGKSAPELSGWRLVEERRSGKFRLRVLANPSPSTVAYDFLAHVAEATVVDVRAGVETPCPWNTSAHRSAGGLHGEPAYPAARHVCPGPESHFAGVTVVEDEQWRGRRCLWAYPVQGAALTIRYPAVPLGKVVRGHAALPWWTERELRGAPVELTIVVAGAELGKVVHQDGEGWRGFEVPTGAHAGTRADVEFRVTSSRANGRQFCFQADTR